jgi:hypothetical protein
MEGGYNVLVSIGKLWLCRLPLNRHGAADAADLAWRLADRTGPCEAKIRPCEAKIRQLGLNSLSGPFFFGRYGDAPLTDQADCSSTVQCGGKRRHGVSHYFLFLAAEH